MAAWLHSCCRSVCLAARVHHIDRRTMFPGPSGLPAKEHFAQEVATALVGREERIEGIEGIEGIVPARCRAPA